MAKISPATMTAAIFAILIGLVGAYAVRQFLSQAEVVAEQQEPEEQKPPEMVYVPVAARDMQIGQKVTINDIVIRKIIKAEFGDSEFVGQQFMTATDQITGRQLQSDLTTGSVFKPDSFFPDGMGPGITRLLQPGQRAVTVPIRNIGAVEGFAAPGTQVDVMFRSEPAEEMPETTLTLLEYVEVLAIDRIALPGQVAGAGMSGPATVTLAVSPPQAKALKAVEGRGELSLALRHPDDDGSIVSIGLNSSDHLTLNQLIGGPPPKRETTMEIFNAGQRQVMTFVDRSPRRSLNPGLIRTPVGPGNIVRDQPADTDSTVSQVDPESVSVAATATVADDKTQAVTP